MDPRRWPGRRNSLKHTGLVLPGREQEKKDKSSAPFHEDEDQWGECFADNNQMKQTATIKVLSKVILSQPKAIKFLDLRYETFCVPFPFIYQDLKTRGIKMLF